jgi:hypothetical protein
MHHPPIIELAEPYLVKEAGYLPSKHRSERHADYEASVSILNVEYECRNSGISEPT